MLREKYCSGIFQNFKVFSPSFIGFDARIAPSSTRKNTSKIILKIS